MLPCFFQLYASGAACLGVAKGLSSVDSAFDDRLCLPLLAYPVEYPIVLG